jgi:CheY-like chemotaxis protein
MKGRIWLESKPGAGSTFHFTACFPAKKAAPVTDETDLSPLAGVPVLIADDNASSGQLLEMTLKGWGMRPVAVNRGADALLQLRNAKTAGEPFPVLLIDAHLPDLREILLAGHMEEGGLQECRVVLMIATGIRAGTTKSAGWASVLHLNKPIKRSDLLSVLMLIFDPAIHKQGQPPATDCRRAGRTVRRLTILLAEDNRVNQTLAIRLLEKNGHKVVLAETGKAVLKILELQAVDLILMDVQMPEMDGFEATRNIRRLEQGSGRRVPIIAMTANAMIGDKERCLQSGMDAYIPKPLSVDKLFATIESITADSIESSSLELMV